MFLTMIRLLIKYGFYILVNDYSSGTVFSNISNFGLTIGQAKYSLYRKALPTRLMENTKKFTKKSHHVSQSFGKIECFLPELRSFGIGCSWAQ